MNVPIEWSKACENSWTPQLDNILKKEKEKISWELGTVIFQSPIITFQSLNFIQRSIFNPSDNFTEYRQPIYRTHSFLIMQILNILLLVIFRMYMED